MDNIVWQSSWASSENHSVGSNKQPLNKQTVSKVHNASPGNLHNCAAAEKTLSKLIVEAYANDAMEPKALAQTRLRKSY